LLWAQQPAPTFSTVDDLVRAGISNNKDLAATRQRLEEAKGFARQARVVPSPRVDLSGSTGNPLGSPDENQYGAGLSQTIETFGKRVKRARVADLEVAKAEADLQERSAQLAYEIRAAYSEVTAQRHKVKLLTDLIGLNQEALRLTEARVNEGDVPRLEANLLKVEISRAEIARKSAQGRLASAEIELRLLAALDQSSAIPEADSSAAPASTLDDLKQWALSNRADLKSARVEEEEQSAAVALAKAEWKPDLSLTAGYSRQSSAFEGLFAFNGSGALSPIRDRVDILNFGVSIPLRTSRSGAGHVQAASARASGASLRREYLERNIPLQVESAYQRWRTAADSVTLLQDGVLAPSAANLAVIQEAYKLGQLRLLDVINEQRRLVDTQMQFIDAQTDVARTWAEVERATGGNLP
jgi:cobalt-zinc-cadmium efflux system outer membrane protein